MLISAVICDAVETFEEALRRGVGINDAGRDGLNALQTALLWGRDELAVRLLAQGADARTLESISPPCNRIAISYAHAQVWRAAVHAGLPTSSIPAPWIFCAAAAPDSAILCALTNLQAKLDVLDEAGCSPLHAAAAAGRATNCWLLVQEGLDIEAEDHQGLRPLRLAVAREHLPTIQTLVALGASAEGIVCVRPEIASMLTAGPLCAAVDSRLMPLLLESIERGGDRDASGIARALERARTLAQPEMEAVLRSTLASRLARDAMADVAGASPGKQP